MTSSAAKIPSVRVRSSLPTSEAKMRWDALCTAFMLCDESAAWQDIVATAEQIRMAWKGKR